MKIIFTLIFSIFCLAICLGLPRAEAPKTSSSEIQYEDPLIGQLSNTIPCPAAVTGTSNGCYCKNIAAWDHQPGVLYKMCELSNGTPVQCCWKGPTS